MLTVNGNEFESEAGISIGTLLELLELADQPCAVEVNQELVPHKQRETYVLNEGDNVEIVTLVGGG